MYACVYMCACAHKQKNKVRQFPQVCLMHPLWDLMFQQRSQDFPKKGVLISADIFVADKRFIVV